MKNRLIFQSEQLLASICHTITYVCNKYNTHMYLYLLLHTHTHTHRGREREINSRTTCIDPKGLGIRFTRIFSFIIILFQHGSTT